MKKNNLRMEQRTTKLQSNARLKIFGIVKTLALLVTMTLYFSACKKNGITEQEKVTDGLKTKSDFISMLSINSLNSFKVLSFNVRHNDPEDPQTITQRQTLIKKVIINNAPDIFGLQEFSDNGFETWFANEMTLLGYGYYWDEAASGAGNPRVIFFKSSRFTMEGNGTWNIGQTNTATYVKLLDNITNRRYFISNSHWQYNSQADRIVNAQKLAEGIALYNTGNYPKIVFGDFNAQPNTTEINNLKSTLDLVDALGDTESGKTFHGWGDTGTTKLDWMMSDRSMSFLSWSIYDQKVDGYWPSDHWAVMATYVPAVFGGPNVDANGGSAVAVTKYYFADINGDGKDDKIFWRDSYDSGKVRVFLSNGNGTFANAVSHAASASTKTTTKYYFADVNNDGKADLIKWDYDLNSGHSFVYLATTNGNFSATGIDNPYGPSGVASTIYNFADVNGDGRADKIFWRNDFDSGKLRVYLATTTDGQFSAGVVVGTEGASTQAGTTYYFADLNADGKKDAIFWHPAVNSGQTTAFLSNGNGTFTAAPSFNPAAPSGAVATKFFFTDVDGDGRADKIYWNPNNYLGKLKVYYNQPNNTFEGPVYSLRGTSQSANTQFFFADINGASGGIRKADQIRWNYGEDSGTLRNYFAN